ncbi:exodeoxyribonuclease VII large subunit [Peptoniphilus sp. HMSC075B08]|uniref:exodeoxyribonuclease VII large subunit n=1 Tax=Peptoniphilus sp. HMSC075B08 TaxID=1739525 RepID=UPI0008A5AC28|nr:exodeoxyribonuclease VII large subunit [Peptoniphilus sp. HMSC075B08]OFO62841.1 exodeoxyribonuclease VII large subunit [Peptoniphilus sp. HMSC075B08]
MAKSAFNVSELNNYIKKLISMDYILRDIKVTGEITNLNYHKNGNIYFSLKDKFARIDAMASQEDIKINIFDGAKVMAKGTVTYYDRSGRVFLYISQLELDGKGNLYQEYLDLKEKLSKEGLFDPGHKKRLKKYPSRIGLITSTSGAAIEDVINIFRKRNKTCDVFIYPSLVQGAYAAETLISGVKYFNEEEAVDTIIIARGGGSFEDLFVFNDEGLAREIFASKIPVISAVGHEVDYTICDFVADMRAATPTNAAELVTISEDQIFSELEKKKSQLKNLMDRRLDFNRLRLLNLYKNISIKNQVYKINERTRDLLRAHALLNFSMKKIIEDHEYDLQEKKFYLGNFKLKESKDLENYSYRLKNISVNINSRINKDQESLNFDKKLLNYYFKTYVNDNHRKVKSFEKFLAAYDLSVRLKNEKNRLNLLKMGIDSAFEKINKVEILTEDGKNLKSAREARPGDLISLKFKDGQVESKVQKVEVRD